MGEIALMAENHDCNDHFDFEPYETEFRTKFLAEHPEMADDYEEKLRIQLAGNAEQLAFNLYKEADKYFMLNDTLTERVYISKETADSILGQIRLI